MEKGKIIFLNGVSSSGKTTLAKALQDLLPEPPYYISNDLFAGMVPGKNFSDDKKVDESFSMMYSLIKTFSDNEVNVVVDSLLLSSRRMNQCVEALHDYPVLFVHVKCPAEELRRREEKRGDREIGQSENQLVDLVPTDTYDVTVDTFTNAKEDCTDKIIDMLNTPEKFMAFKKLWSQRRKDITTTFKNIKDQLDNPTIREIMKAFVYENSPDSVEKKITEYRNNANWSIYGWIENDEIIGVCGFKVRHDEQAEILHIAVTENARGRGVGSSMVSALRSLFCLPIKAETDDDAVDFYRKLDFVTSDFEKHGVRRWACVLEAPIAPTPIKGIEANKVVINYMPKITEEQLWDFYFRNQICEAGYGKEGAVESLENKNDYAVAAFYEDKLVGFIRVCSCGDIKEACLELTLQGDNLENDNGSLIEKDQYGIFKKMGLLLIDELIKQGIDFVSMTIVENLEESAFTSIGMEHNTGHKVFIKDMRMYV